MNCSSRFALRFLPAIFAVFVPAAAWPSEPRRDPAVEFADRERIEKILDQRGDFSYRGVTLANFARDLSKRFSLNIVFDPMLHEETINPDDAEIDFEAKDITVASALNRGLSQLRLAALPVGELLQVTTHEKYDCAQLRSISDVRDLLPSDDATQNAGLRAMAEQSLLDFCVTATGLRKTRFGSPPRAFISNGRLVLHGDTDFRVAPVLGVLRNMLAERERLRGPWKLPIDLLIRNDRPEYRAIQAKLAQRVSVAGGTVTLQALVDWLKKKHGLPIEFDTATLKEATIDPAAYEFRMRRLKDVRVETLLRCTLRELGLEFIVADDCIYITTKASDCSDRDTAVFYDISDLPAGKVDDPYSNAAESLMASIRTVGLELRVDSWHDDPWEDEPQGVRVPGHLRIFRGILVARGQPSEQREIESLLFELRVTGKSQPKQEHRPDREAQPKSDLPAEREMHLHPHPQPQPARAVRSASKRRSTKLSKRPTQPPANRTKTAASKQTDTDPLITDPNVADPNVAGPDVTGPHVTGPHVTGPDVTCPAIAENPLTDRLETRIYRLSAMAPRAPKRATIPLDAARAQQLAEAIPQLAERASWKSAGGQGTLHAIGDQLAIHQTPLVHFRVRQFLAELGYVIEARQRRNDVR